MRIPCWLKASTSGGTLRYGLTRGYATRHGAGPFVTEDRKLTEAIQDAHNANNRWQQAFRVGYLDLVALRYALRVIGKVDGLVITNLDRIAELQRAIPEWQACNYYQSAGVKGEVSEYFDDQDGLVKDIKGPSRPNRPGAAGRAHPAVNGDAPRIHPVRTRPGGIRRVDRPDARPAGSDHFSWARREGESGPDFPIIRASAAPPIERHP